MWNSLSKLAALPDATRVYCGHEYTQSNARFALTSTPTIRRSAGAPPRSMAARGQGQPTIPTTIGAEGATSPFLRAADPAIRRRLGLERQRRRGVRRDPQRKDRA